MSIVLLGSTSGSITLQEPAISGNTVLSLPATSGTILTTGSSGQSIPKAALPTGSVLQVVSTTKSDTFTTTSTSYTDVTGLSVSITPTSSSSKILVIVNLSASVTTADRWWALQLVRGSTAIAIGDAASSRTRSSIGSTLISGTGSGNYLQSFAFNFLDSPATISSTTYKIQGLVQSGVTLAINRTGSDTDADYSNRTASTITVMEIAA